MSWIAENICKFLTDFIGGTIDFFGETINNIFFLIVAFNNTNEYVISANKFLMVLSFALVGLVTVQQVLSGYIMETNYDSEADPFNLLVRIAQSVAVISCSGWIFDFTLGLAKKVSSDLISSTSVKGLAGKTQQLLDIDVSEWSHITLVYLVMICIMIIAYIIFMIVAGLRGAELIVMKLFFPLFAIDLMTTNRERWGNFFVGFLVAFFSYGFQILFFMIAIKSYMSFSITKPIYILGALGFMIASIKSPKFIEKFLYKSGVSSAASGGLRMAAQVFMMKQM